MHRCGEIKKTNDSDEKCNGRLDIINELFTWHRRREELLSLIMWPVCTYLKLVTDKVALFSHRERFFCLAWDNWTRDEGVEWYLYTRPCQLQATAPLFRIHSKFESIASTMQRSVSHTFNRSTSSPSDEISKATIDSVRLSTRGSLPTLCSNIEKVSFSTIDIDIDALDAEFERLSQDFQEPSRSTAERSRQSRAASIVDLDEPKSLPYESCGHRSFARRMVSPFSSRTPLNNARKRFRRENTKSIKFSNCPKAQSAIDLCFLMDCTGSMRKYVDATKTQIRQLTPNDCSILWDQTSSGLCRLSRHQRESRSTRLYRRWKPIRRISPWRTGEWRRWHLWRCLR